MAYLVIDGVVLYVHVYFPILFLREKGGVYAPLKDVYSVSIPP